MSEKMRIHDREAFEMQKPLFPIFAPGSHQMPFFSSKPGEIPPEPVSTTELADSTSMGWWKSHSTFL